MATEISAAIKAIHDSAIDTTVSVAETLRRCLVLAQRLGLEESKRWITAELNGYSHDAQTPPYRIANGSLYGNFMDQWGGQVQNMPMPIHDLTESFQTRLKYLLHMHEPIAALESHIARSQRDGVELIIPMTANQAKAFKLGSGHQCLNAWYVISCGNLIKAVESVRSRALEFAANAEELALASARIGKEAPRMNQATPTTKSTSESGGRPRVFIGSSTEGLKIAEAVQLNLDRAAECTTWSQGVFGLSKGNLENLVSATAKFDYAVLVLTPDDMTVSREVEHNSPRDNVLFELGLFMGALGRDRTFIVYCRDATIKLPSDLAGVAAATFAERSDGNLRAALGAACTELKHAFEQHGRRS